MWTIIWTDDNGYDHYDRFDEKEEMYSYVSEHNLFDNEDTIVFPPEADELSMSVPWVNWD